MARSLAIDSMIPSARKLARSLDSNPAVDRGDGAVAGDGLLNASEVRAGLDSFDTFSSGEKTLLRDMAKKLGMAAPPPPTATTWVDSPAAPSMQSISRAVAVGDKAFAFDDDKGLAMFDPSSRSWMPLSPPGGKLGLGTSIASFDGKLVVVGGRTESGSASQDRAWVYDPKAATWSKMPSPGAREGATMVEANGKLYIFGGVDRLSWNSTMGINDRVYDPASGWKDLRSVTNRTGAAAVAVGNKVFVIGGRDTQGYPSSEVDVLDASTDQTDRGFSLPRGIDAPSAWVANGTVQVAGSSSAFSIDPTTNEVTSTDSPLNGKDGAIAASGDTTFVFGTGFTHVLAPPAVNIFGAPGQDDDALTESRLTSPLRDAQPVTAGDASASQVTLDLSKTSIGDSITAPVLSLDTMGGGKQAGFFDPDNGFFLRTRADGADLPLTVGTDADGTRVLVGNTDGSKGPLPHASTGELYLYNPSSQSLVPISTDHLGRFAEELPANAHGLSYVFSMRDGQASALAPIQLP